jgi:hypothetical protein
MASSARKVKLNNGVEIPIIGEQLAIATPPNRSNNWMLITLPQALARILPRSHGVM